MLKTPFCFKTVTITNAIVTEWLQWLHYSISFFIVKVEKGDRKIFSEKLCKILAPEAENLLNFHKGQVGKLRQHPNYTIINVFPPAAAFCEICTALSHVCKKIFVNVCEILTRAGLFVIIKIS